MLRLLSVWLLLVVTAAPALSRTAEEMAALVTPPLQFGEKDPELPIYRLLDGGNAPVGWAFETIDLAPLPGFSGTPINLFVAINDRGDFLDVRILDQNEPVFVSGLGPQPLGAFVQQYAGRSLASAYKIGHAQDREQGGASAAVILDGVSKATASVNIVNDTILAASLEVARARLTGVAPRPSASPIPGIFEPKSFAELIEDGLIGHIRLTNADVRQAFPDYAPEGADGAEDAVFLEVWTADLGVPMVAGNLFTDEALAEVKSRIWPHEEPILVLAAGHGTIKGEDFVPRATPDRLSIGQGEFAVAIRDSDATIELKGEHPYYDEALVLRADRRLGFDPGSPWTLKARLVAQKNILEAPIVNDFPITVSPPPELFEVPVVEADRPAWMLAWIDRAAEIALLLVFLGVVAVLLANMRRIANPPRRLEAFRLSALAITLGFVGWYGQGQLSVVNILAVAKGAVDGADLTVLLYDPFTVIIWPVAISALFVWGRGTFCGWFCPFGALQEFASKIGRTLGIREYEVPARLDSALKLVKYGVLVAILAGAFSNTETGSNLVEFEPFKTAITVGFDREWYYVAYAVGLVLLSPFVFKAYCRYLCPLGAFLALGGRVRALSWIPRRAECGSPCRLCERRCRYGAIEKTGRIDYAECFQCLDCVSIHDDAATCVPLVLKARVGRPMPGREHARPPRGPALVRPKVRQ